MSDRHEKWVRVEPGHVIPAGQPHAIDFSRDPHCDSCQWAEYVRDADHTALTADDWEWFVDSSWRPPLNLPTEPTWGIAVYGACHTWTERLYLDLDGKDLRGSIRGGNVRASEIVDFIPLTDEQVARIEAAR